MRKKRRNHSAAFKAKVAFEAIKNQKTSAVLAQEFEVHPSQIAAWKKQLFDQANSIFEQPSSRQNDQEAMIENLYTQIGKLKVELEWLKKKATPFC